MTAKDDLDEALLKALHHPFRRMVLRRYLETDTAYGLSPKELALALRAPLPKVAYHVRELSRFGAVEIVSEARVRGSVAHFYEATPLVRQTPWVLTVLGLTEG